MDVEGRCHCGNLSFVIAVTRPLAELRVGACDCSFCRTHGAKCVSDPRARATIRVRDPGQLERYRFGLNTADFLVCRTCGVYLGAFIEVDGTGFSTLNVRATTVLRDRDAAVRSWGGESAAERVARRARTWTPTEIVVGGMAE